MKRQQKVQLALIFSGILLIILTYFYYPNVNKNKLAKDKVTIEIEEIDEVEEINQDEQTTSFKDVEYKGLYDLDKTFTVSSEKAYILNNEPDIVYMSNMHVILYLTDGRIVNIVSDKGRFNKTTNDCFFEKNVKANDGETLIFAENLDLLATNNSVEIYNNVSLDYTTGSLRADKIVYDFEKKHFKVSMYNDKSIEMKLVK